MFLTAAHILLKRSQPSILVQLVIGITCYLAVFALLIVRVKPSTNVWIYFILPVFAIDASYFIYATSTRSPMAELEPRQAEMHVAIDTGAGPETPPSYLINSSTAEDLHNPTLSSEVNDYRVSHDLSLSSEDALAMFSTSEEEGYHA